MARAPNLSVLVWSLVHWGADFFLNLPTMCHSRNNAKQWVRLIANGIFQCFSFKSSLKVTFANKCTFYSSRMNDREGEGLVVVTVVGGWSNL